MGEPMLSCPFCGSDDIVMSRNYNPRYRAFFVWIECVVCGSRSRSFSCTDDPANCDWNNLACHRAVASWNRRVNTCQTE